MENKTIYLVRHGLATKSTTGYGDKILTAELLPEAIPSIHRLANYLKDKPTDYNVSSEILRCKQTAAIITSRTDKKFVFDSRLNEYYQETFLQFSNRITLFFNDLKTKPYQNILICTHGAVIAGLKHLILSDSFTEENLTDYPPCGSLLTIRNGSFEVTDFN